MRNKARLISILLVLLGSPSAVLAESPANAADVSAPRQATASGPEEPNQPQLLLRAPLIDLPFNISSGYSFPSMYQSVYLSSGVNQWVHQMIGSIWPERDNIWKTVGTYLLIALYDVNQPFDGWNHEEGHCACLTVNRIPHEDDIYRTPFAEMVSVSHVKDEDLAWLKNTRPADFTRLCEAGGENEIAAVLAMQKNNFFNRRCSAYDRFDWWLRSLGLIYYVNLCATAELDALTQAGLRAEGPDPDERDIVGGDYSAWVYDLFNPDLAYESGAHGRPHPTGVGVSRYIQFSDLTDEQVRYLQLQQWLLALNFLSPQFWGFDRFQTRNPFAARTLTWNAGLVHQLTSFGSSTDVNLFLQQDEANIFIAYHNYCNRDAYFPGLTAELIRCPVEFNGRPAYLSAGVSAWLQPQNQRFDSKSAAPGAQATLEISLPVMPGMEIFARGDAKTAGWVMGNPYLEGAVQFQTGIIGVLPSK